VLTQWFERARFEYVPSNPDPYKVLLGRLGAEAYDASAGTPLQYHQVQAPGWPHPLEVPNGFTIDEVASGIPSPSFMALDPLNGSLVYGSSTTSQVVRLIDTNGDGRYDQTQIVAGGLAAVHSVAFVSVGGTGGYPTLYAAAEDRVVVLSDFDANGTAQRVDKLLDLPTGATDLYGHRTRTIAQGPDGKLYISVGSSCDVCVEDTPLRAAILRANVDGSGVEVFAAGLRNTVGFDWRPGSNALWGADMGRNNLGQDKVSDELDVIEQGKNYGWPYCYDDALPNPEYNDPAKCAGTGTPALKFPPHWAPLGFVFYQQPGFPPSYQGDALVAFHGTAKDQVQTLGGYLVARVRFHNGRPVAIEDLVRGWNANGDTWGRPAGLLVLPDGSVLISDDAGGRIILLNEWDSIYARSFAWALRHSLPCPKANRDSHLRLENYTLPARSGRGQYRRRRPPGAARAARRQVQGRQAAFHRMAGKPRPAGLCAAPGRTDPAEADRGGPGEQVRAIGVIGTDVNDKLLLVQALRGAFSDRVLFTTDMDARLLHPEAVRYTRNLVVASSLPLVLDDDKVLKAGVGPFRDVYQTAAFLGARYASADDEKAKHLLAAIETQLANPRLYEIGRDSAVELGTEKRPAQEQDRRTGYALLTAVVLLVLGGFMLGRPAPAMRAALPWNNGSAAPFELSTAIVAGLEAGAWGFALGIVIDLGLPDHMGPARAWLLALAFMLLFWAVVYPGLRFPPAARTDVYVSPLPDWRRRQLALRLLLIVLPLCFVWFELAPEADGMREPFAPASGVSAWPSQLLRTLGVVLFAWFLDYAWGRSADTARRIGADYFPPDSPPSAALPPMPLSQRVVDAIALLSAWAHDRFRRARSDWRGFAGHRLRRLATVLAEDSIWFWRPQAVHEGSLEGARVWAEYRRQLLNGPRLGRMLLWLAVAVLFLWVESKLVGGGQPEVPARGLDDRALFSSTILAHVLGTIILLVLVADATVLTWRFIGILKGGRTIYPRSTVERFAAELGPELQAVAAEPITANIDARTSTRSGPAALNSLLDDWIDARLLAQHTAAIGPLIVFPFILVGLLVVARSQLFDNWAISGAVLAGLVCFVLWSIAMAALLNFGAEIARRRAIERMEEDLLWLQGRGDKYKALAERFPTLIDKVRRLRQGAFAPFFEQPLVQAILVPLGGAGGVQLIEMFMFARS
jgi:glucose/arabinose dehydrogenase